MGEVTHNSLLFKNHSCYKVVSIGFNTCFFAVKMLFPINAQGEKQLRIFYALAKKGVTAPAVLQVTQQQLLVNGETVIL